MKLPALSFISPILISLGIFAPAAHALDGGMTGGGGDAVVCFREGTQAQQYLANGMLTRSGRAELRQPETVVWALDYFRVKDSPHLVKIDAGNNNSHSSISFALIKKLEVLPGLYDAMSKDAVQPIEDGNPLTGGLEDIADSMRIEGLPENCADVQAAVQRGTQIDYDADLWAKMDAIQKAVLETHEYIYHYARKIRNHQDSTSVRLLIGYLLTHNGDHSFALKETVKDLELGEFKTIEENISTINYLNKLAYLFTQGDDIKAQALKFKNPVRDNPNWSVFWEQYSQFLRDGFEDGTTSQWVAQCSRLTKSIWAGFKDLILDTPQTYLRSQNLIDIYKLITKQFNEEQSRLKRISKKAQEAGGDI